MSDIVKRLRDDNETCGIDKCKVRNAISGCMCAVAADRIERLEAALTKWIEWHERDGSVGGASLVYDETRAALKENEND